MKLLRCKRWLTIKDASKILTNIIDEKVKAKDIYRLAMDDKIVLSLLFVNDTYVNVSEAQANFEIKKLQFKNKYRLIKGGTCLDLSNTDNCKLILKQHYYNHSIPLKLRDKRGIACILTDNITPCRLINYKEDDKGIISVEVAHSLPLDVIIVIRTDYLAEFADRVKRDQQIEINRQIELANKEKAAVYKLIVLLAKALGLPIEKHYKTADIIINELAPKLGIATPSRETIAKHLKQAYRALPQ